MDEQLQEALLQAFEAGTLTKESLAQWMESQPPEVFDDTTSIQSEFLNQLNNSTIGKVARIVKQATEIVPKIYQDTAVLKEAKRDLKDAQAQLAKANEREAALTTPEFTQPTTDTRAVDRSIEQAERDAATAGQSEIAAIKDEIRRNYSADIQQAKTASTGQAGNVQNQAQLAANRRNRSLRDASLVQNNLRNQALGRRDANIDRRTNIQMTNDQLRQRGDYLRENRYQREIDRIEDLGATARSNIRNARYNMIPARRDIMTDVGNLAQTAIGAFMTPQRIGRNTQAAPPPNKFTGAPNIQFDVNQAQAPPTTGVQPYEFQPTPSFGAGPDMDMKQYQSTLFGNPYVTG